jgi:hypothetical protein
VQQELATTSMLEESKVFRTSSFKGQKSPLLDSSLSWLQFGVVYSLVPFFPSEGLGIVVPNALSHAVAHLLFGAKVNCSYGVPNSNPVARKSFTFSRQNNNKTQKNVKLFSGNWV